MDPHSNELTTFSISSSPTPTGRTPNSLLQENTYDSLQFQDIPHSSRALGTSDSSSLLPSSSTLDSSTLSNIDIASSPSAVSDNPEQVNYANSPIYTLNYYKQFFDVTTEEIISRLFRVFIPFTSFYTDDSKPDLYGPFWITTTITFLLAATGNFSDYISYSFTNSSNLPSPLNSTTPHPDARNFLEWHYDFQKVTVSASVLYGWLIVVPLVLYCAVGYVGQNHRGWVETMSVHGYALLPYLPAVLLCMIPISIARWLILSVALGLSCAFLLRNLWPNGQATDKVKVYPFLAVVIALDVGIALLTKLYFFGD